MKTIFKLAFVALLVLTYSCDKGSAVESAEEFTAVSLKGGKDVERPISITLKGADDPDGGLATYTGKMKHLGKIYGTVAPSDFLPDPENPGTFNLSTIGQCGDDQVPEVLDVIIAANGDKIFSRGELVFVFVSETSATYSGTIFFCGGTGRFEGATGTMEIADGVYNITGVSNVDPTVFIGEFSHTGNGTITY